MYPGGFCNLLEITYPLEGYGKPGAILKQWVHVQYLSYNLRDTWIAKSSRGSSRCLWAYVYLVYCAWHFIFFDLHNNLSILILHMRKLKFRLYPGGLFESVWIQSLYFSYCKAILVFEIRKGLKKKKKADYCMTLTVVDWLTWTLESDWCG